MSEVLKAVAARKSYSKVTDEAPTHEELLELVRAAGRVADHSSLRPWRVIEIRGDARDKVGKALAKAAGDKPGGHISKVRRAPLLLAVVLNHKSSGKVPRWEQEAVASGVAHILSLLLHDAGWGVFWRTGTLTRKKAVAKAHGLGKHESLLGWLYVGGIPERGSKGSRRQIDPEVFLTQL